MMVHVVYGTLMEQLLGEAHRYMKAEGKQGRRKYPQYGKSAYVSTPLPAVMQALLPGAPIRSESHDELDGIEGAVETLNKEAAVIEAVLLG